MAAWVTRTSYLSAEDVAKEEARYNDPAMRKAREELREVAMTATKNLTAGTIAGYVGGSWLPFSSPAAPITPAHAQRLVREFREEYAATFTEIGDESKARELTVQRLGRIWGTSDLVGGALMRFPPEKAYPTINGSHDWIKKQLDEAVHSSLVSMGALVEDLAAYAAGGRDPNTQDVSSSRNTAALKLPRMLVSDERTEAEFNAGRTPSYPVVVKAPNGMFVPLQGPDGGVLRFYADPQQEMAPRRADAEQRLYAHREALASQDRFEEGVQAQASRRRGRRAEARQ